jgi:glycogen synthase
VRVLIVGDVVGGVRTFVEELTRELAARDVEVHLALIGRDAPKAADLAASCVLRELKLEWMDGEDRWSGVEATSEWIEELRQSHRPDVIHMNTFTPVHDAHVPVLLTAHSCVLTWWRAVHGENAPSEWARYGWLVRRGLDRAHTICTPTRALLEDMAAVYGPLPRTRVIPNGRSIAKQRSPLAPAPRRRERLVVSVGRLWDEAKNAALLVRAGPEIDARVALIGPHHRSFGGVEQLGPLSEDEVARWLSRAAVFAEPARYEPFGLAALEAALCGCALVLGDIPSLREVWGDAASYVAPDDAPALARSVNALVRDPVRRDRAASAARARAARYTPAAMAGAYLDAYREMARTAIPA